MENTRVQPICPRYIEIGSECENTCPNRHIIMDQDLVDKETLEGHFIKLELIKILTANHFLMRVKAYRTTDRSKWNEFDTWDTLDENLRKHYSQKIIHRVHSSPNVGDLCAILLDGKPYRCCIENNLNDNIRISLIDYGRMEKCKPTEILELKKEFQDIPPQFVSVYVQGIRPADNELKWSKAAKMNVSDWFKNVPVDNTSDFYIEANVVLHLKDTLLVDEIKLVEKSPDSLVKVTFIKKELIKNMFAVSDSSGIKNLRKKVFELKSDSVKQEKLVDATLWKPDENTTPFIRSSSSQQNILDIPIPESLNKVLPVVHGTDKEKLLDGTFVTPDVCVPTSVQPGQSQRNILDSPIPEIFQKVLPLAERILPEKFNRILSAVRRSLGSNNDTVDNSSNVKPSVKEESKVEAKNKDNCSHLLEDDATVSQCSVTEETDDSCNEQKVRTLKIDLSPSNSLELENPDAVAEDVGIIEKIRETLIQFSNSSFKWASLEENHFEQVEVSAFYTPENLYLRNTTQFKER